MKYQYFDHTADVMFEAYGKNMNQAFCHAGLAMFNILTDITKVKSITDISFNITRETYEKLLFDFLDELLFYLDTEHLIFSEFDITINKVDEGFVLSCKARGDHALNYETHGDVKAPTYNEMLITQNKNKVTLRVVVDI